MKAAYIEKTGPACDIVVGELEKPTISGDQVLVKVSAVSLNPVDTYIRSGAIAFDLPQPFIVGCDLAGVVEEVGPTVRFYKPGDRVWGTNQGLLGRQGTFAEYAAVDQCWLYPTPDDVRDEDAAAMALVGITAHLGLVRDAYLQQGETLFVNGGTGGVGSTVVQMAKALGANVITTCGSDEKCEIARSLGADLAINYKTQDVPQAIKQFAPAGVHIFWETLREPDFDFAVEMLAERGRMIIMAGREARPEFPAGAFYVKGCTLRGFVMFKATPEEQQVCAKQINQWLSSKKIAPRIDRIVNLEETAAMHQLQEDNTVNNAGTLAGKIVLKP